MSQGQDWNAPGAQSYYQQQQPPAGQAYQQPYQQAAMVPAGAYGMPGIAPTAPVPPGFYYDQLSGLVLPDGTQVASVGRRIGSYFLAGVLCFVTLGIGYLIWGAITWSKGQTPTQSLLGMQTWKPQTRANTSWGEQFVREISRLIYAIPFVGIVSFFLFVSGKEHRTLHDSMGGTVVLYDPNKVLQPVQYQPAA